jgi:hypothetical protein
LPGRLAGRSEGETLRNLERALMFDELVSAGERVDVLSLCLGRN